MMMYADMILLPIYLQNGRGFTAFDAGLLLLPGAIINAFMSPVTGKMYDRFTLFVPSKKSAVQLTQKSPVQLTEKTGK
jgi:Na+/melibiose symporter-like transporter